MMADAVSQLIVVHVPRFVDIMQSHSIPNVDDNKMGKWNHLGGDLSLQFDSKISISMVELI
jgi:hypothetical protein